MPVSWLSRAPMMCFVKAFKFEFFSLFDRISNIFINISCTLDFGDLKKEFSNKNKDKMGKTHALAKYKNQKEKV